MKTFMFLNSGFCVDRSNQPLYAFLFSLLYPKDIDVVLWSKRTQTRSLLWDMLADLLLWLKRLIQMKVCMRQFIFKNDLRILVQCPPQIVNSSARNSPKNFVRSYFAFLISWHVTGRALTVHCLKSASFPAWMKVSHYLERVHWELTTRPLVLVQLHRARFREHGWNKRWWGWTCTSPARPAQLGYTHYIYISCNLQGGRSRTVEEENCCKKHLHF